MQAMVFPRGCVDHRLAALRISTLLMWLLLPLRMGRTNLQTVPLNASGRRSRHLRDHFVTWLLAKLARVTVQIQVAALSNQGFKSTQATLQLQAA